MLFVPVQPAPLTLSHMLASRSCVLCVQPVYLHGSLGREAATGRGVALAIRELLKASNAGKVAEQKYVIQVRKRMI